jgi:hypothetical protein
MTRRTMTIDKAVAWAYRDELPKGQGVPGHYGAVPGEAWRGIGRFGESLAVIDQDRVNRYGVVADLAAMTAPHDDALAIHEAVMELDALEVGLPDDWHPIADAGLGAEALPVVAAAFRKLTVTGRDGMVRPREAMSELMRRCAILGAPDWTLTPPVKREVTHDNGRPRWFRKVAMVSDGAFAPASYTIEVDGFDAKRRRPHPDAYRKFEWDPDPTDAAVERGRYELWRAGLDALVEMLDGRLSDVRVTLCDGAARPWLEEAKPAGRVLPSLLMPVVARPAGRMRAKAIRGT